MDLASIRRRIFSISNPHEFNETALDIFRYQSKFNPVYREFVNRMGIVSTDVHSLEQVPFLPISFFKSHKVIAEGFTEQLTFESSGTTGMIPSRHFVADSGIYEESFSRGFERFYGDISKYCIFALLPSYLERGNSSLVYMVERLRWKSNQSFGGFFLNETEQLLRSIKEAQAENHKVILFGVTFALLELADSPGINLEDVIIFETGGMKGRGKELTRMELHDKLCTGLGVKSVHSEYGMTELLSQAWSKGDGRFTCPPWMKIVISDPNDPMDVLENGRSGGIQVIDLANLYSCSFIATQDLGRKFSETEFEVLGRFDHSDIRGCSLMLS